MNYHNELKLAIDAAQKAGVMLKSSIQKTIEMQDGRDIKLLLDKQSESLIIDELQASSAYSILSEERGLIDNLSDHIWIIDPIDGTLNFSRGNPSSCVSIALYKGKNPVLGVIYDFNRDELFTGLIGTGVCINGETVKPAPAKEKNQSILATGFPTYLSHDEKTLKDFILKVQEYKKIRMIGSAALSIAYVAAGRFDTYMENSIKLWDIAAGAAIIIAGGGTVDIKENKEEYSVNIICAR